MNYLIEAEDVVEVAKDFLDSHPWDAALYEAWVSIQGKTGCAAHNGFLVFLAHKYGVSKQAIQQAIKRERARREAQP